MKKAKKGQLPSGNYRTRVCIGKNEAGIRKFKSFIAKTKTEADYMAESYLRQNGRKSKPSSNMTLREAYESYIERRDKILSPSTVREYSRAARNDFPSLMGLKISELTQDNIQLAVNQCAANHSPKTVKNAHGLLRTVLSEVRPELILRTDLPKKKKPDINIPSEDQLKALLEATKGTELGKAILLAAFGGLRRSEIVALTADDIDRDNRTISVNQAMVLSVEKQWILKQPKTIAGYRKVEIPQFVIDQLPTNGQLVKLYPSSITDRFHDTVKQLGLPYFRFHDLRHYHASILHAIGVPDKYIMERGGWSTDSTLKNVYQHTMSNIRKKYDGKACKFFAETFENMCHEVCHNA